MRCLIPYWMVWFMNKNFSWFLLCLDQFWQHGPQHYLPIERSTFICTITDHFSKFYISHNGTLMLEHTPRRKKKTYNFFIHINLQLLSLIFFYEGLVERAFKKTPHKAYYMIFHLSCLYAWLHTWWPVTGMPIMHFRVNVRF